MYDLLIIGSGPAGMSAAVYAQRAKLHCAVIEKLPMGGGQILNTYEVDNYPGIPKTSGFELGTQLRKHAEAVGTEFIQTEVQSIEKKEDYFALTTAKGTFEARAIIAASGARHRELGVPGEKDLTGMGVSYCATCDGAFFRNRTVAVVG